MNRLLALMRQVRRTLRRRRPSRYRPEEEYCEGYEDVYSYRGEQLAEPRGSGGGGTSMGGRWRRTGEERSPAVLPFPPGRSERDNTGASLTRRTPAAASDALSSRKNTSRSIELLKAATRLLLPLLQTSWLRNFVAQLRKSRR
ncbi:unnamed protein product [Lampetra fluviatilis]